MILTLLENISFFCDGLDGWFARKFNQGNKLHPLYVKPRSPSAEKSNFAAFLYVETLAFARYLTLGK
jgi:hypothetical protein